jgi:hypothetical protein
LAAVFPGRPWWRGGKRLRNYHSPSSASTSICVVLWRCYLRAPSSGTHYIFDRRRDLRPAWRPNLYLQHGGLSSRRLSKLDVSPPPSGSCPEEEERPTPGTRRHMYALERFGIGSRRFHLEIADKRWRRHSRT